MKFKKSYFSELLDYIASGSETELTPEEMEYLDMLYALIGIYHREGEDNAVKFVMHKPWNCSFPVARRLVTEAINLFHGSSDVGNDAYRNIIFSNLQKAALVVLENASCAKDMEIYGNLMVQAAKIKGLDKPDPVKMDLPEEKTIKIYGIDPGTIGLPAVNRQELARIIDGLDSVAEKEKVRLRRDAGIEDIDIEEMLDDQEKKTKDL